VSPDSGVVRFERRGATAFVTFDRPQARNALTWVMYEQLSETLEQLDQRDGLRVAVLRGTGGSFIAGTDIAQFRTFESGDDGIEYERKLDRIIACLEAVAVPTIAVVEGSAMGGGLAITAACDLRICTPDARFGVPIARTVGNCLSMANYARLVAHLGVARTKALLFTADFMGAAEAHAIGFVNEIIEPARIEERVSELCRRLTAHAPITLQVTKEALRRIMSLGVPEGEDLIRRAYGSRDFHEGVSAFLEKREARWEGR
jgi:enoyl-CoA hydratase